MFFFFKQKTAYEMRISDWSSDVCSSDLGDGPAAAVALGQQRGQDVHLVVVGDRDHRVRGGGVGLLQDLGVERVAVDHHGALQRLRHHLRPPLVDLDELEVHVRVVLFHRMGQVEADVAAADDDDARSEEHTSELQSLMRISYAVFCLKNKNN